MGCAPFEIEKELMQRGYRLVAGVDEAGRGPLAGPVFAAAVILDPDDVIEGLDDSKKLTPKKRDMLYDEIKRRAAAWAICSSDEKKIDEMNILAATLDAMSRAIEGLSARPDFVIVDGNQTPPTDIGTMAVIKGDSRSASIAAASILAKVERDRFMDGLDGLYPQYGFKKHKGYPTAEHRAAIIEYGPSPVHRRSFLKNLDRWRRED